MRACASSDGPPDIINARVVPATCAGDGEEVPVPEDAEERFARWDYASGEELLALCEREHVTIAQAFRAREEAPVRQAAPRPASTPISIAFWK